MDSDRIIKVENLTHNYVKEIKEAGLKGSFKRLINPKTQSKKALDNVSLEIKLGETVGLIGHNGAGKTTLIKILCGLILPSEGRVSVLNNDPFKKSGEFLSRISLVSGNKTQLWMDISALDSFELIRIIYGINKSDYKRKLEELVELLNVNHVLNVPLRKVSLGERMKLELIGSLLHSPSILFLDEPTIGLDIVSRRNIEDFFEAYCKIEKCTIILTSHYIEDIERICNRIIWVDNGKKVFDDSKEELFKLVPEQKVINVVVKDTGKDINWESFGTIVNKGYCSASILVDSESILMTMAKLMKELVIVDISIKESPLSDIVHKLFIQSSEKRILA